MDKEQVLPPLDDDAILAAIVRHIPNWERSGLTRTVCKDGIEVERLSAHTRALMEELLSAATTALRENTAISYAVEDRELSRPWVRFYASESKDKAMKILRASASPATEGYSVRLVELITRERILDGGNQPKANESVD